MGTNDNVGLMVNINCEIDLEKVVLPRKNFFKGDYTSCKTYLNDLNCSDMRNFMYRTVGNIF